MAANIRFEQDLRHQLMRQAGAHSDHLADVLQVQEKEIYRKYEVKLDEEILAERDRFRADLAGDITRLRAIEQAVEGQLLYELFFVQYALIGLFHKKQVTG